MNLFFAYSFKVAVCLALFYLFYYWLLSKETFCRFNRGALLVVLLLALVVPLVKVGTDFLHGRTLSQVLGLPTWRTLLIEPLTVRDSGAGTSESSLRWLWLLPALYSAGALFFLGRYVFSLGQLFHLIRRGKQERQADGTVWVRSAQCTTPFSWMHYIVVPDGQEVSDQVRVHEQAHIGAHHSWDLLLANGLIVFQWFNPAAWLLRRELESLHEFYADSKVLESGVNAKEYQLFLIQKAVGTRLCPMANCLNQTNLKKRITMMWKQQSNPWVRLRSAVLLPVVVLAVFACSRNVDENALLATDAATDDFLLELEMDVAINEETQSVKAYNLMDMETMPSFNGKEGLEAPRAFTQWVFERIKYPEQAKANKEEGRVVLSFEVDTEGNVTHVTVLKGVSEALNNEAIRVVSSSPKWNPGQVDGQNVPVHFNFPINFKLR